MTAKTITGTLDEELGMKMRGIPRSGKPTVGSVIGVGAVLNRAREQMRHGEFGSWIQDKAEKYGLSKTTLLRWMELDRREGELTRRDVHGSVDTHKQLGAHRDGEGDGRNLAIEYAEFVGQQRFFALLTTFNTLRTQLRIWAAELEAMVISIRRKNSYEGLTYRDCVSDEELSTFQKAFVEAMQSSSLLRAEARKKGMLEIRPLIVLVNLFDEIQTLLRRIAKGHDLLIDAMTIADSNSQ